MSSTLTDQRTDRRAYRSEVHVGALGLAVVLLGLVMPPAAYADDGSELLDQAGTDLTQATQVLAGVPTSALDARELLGLQGAETLDTNLIQQLPGIETFQGGLSVADQSSPLVLDADQQFLSASQEALAADQAFLLAADAGDLNSLSGYLDAQLPFAESAAGLYGGLIDVEFTDLIAQFDPSLFSLF